MRIDKTESHFKLLADFYNSRVEVNKNILRDSFDKMETKSYKRRFHLVREGDPITKHYFILNGLIRLYYMNKQGQEANVYFGTEGFWISFFFQKMARIPVSTMWNV